LDWLFIIGWSQVAHEEVLSAPAKGAIGMHPTLLPVGRGRAAIPWAILQGLDVTGVTMFQLDGGVDTGPIIAQKTIPLTADSDAGQLYEAVDRAHVELMREIFPKLCEGSLDPQPQDDGLATEWPVRSPEDGEIRTDRSVADAERLVRATTRPYPGAFFGSARRPPHRLACAHRIRWGVGRCLPKIGCACDDLSRWGVDRGRMGLAGQTL
jgi:methionyl-tRNA formyltransferase